MALLHPTLFFWDVVILLLIALCACGATTCVLWLRKGIGSPTGRVGVHGLGILGSLCLLLLVYGSFIEPQTVVATHHTASTSVASPLRIVVLADFHVGPHKSAAFVDRVVQKANALSADLILMPGDFVFGPRSSLRHLQPLQNLSARLGVYATMGNHDVGRMGRIFGGRYQTRDRGNEITSYLENLGITVLRNQHRMVPIPEVDIRIVGIEDLWTGNADLQKAVDGSTNSDLSILISHNPSIINHSGASQHDLIVSGHTHGGQIRLPGIGALIPLPTTLGRTYDHGVFPLTQEESTSHLLLTRGLGEALMRPRLFACPEVMVVDCVPITP